MIDMVNNYRLDPKANAGKTEHNDKGLSVQCRLTTRWGYKAEAPTKDKRRIATFDTGVKVYTYGETGMVDKEQDRPKPGVRN